MTTFADLLEIWYDGAIAQLYSTNDPGEGRLMLGCPIWGVDFFERFTTYCLPTISTGKNLAALAGKSRLVLFVDPAHAQQLAFLVRGLEHKGIQLRFLQIPPEIIKETGQDQGRIYKVLATAQDLLVQTAGRHGLDFHMLMPDHSYSAEVFPNIMRLKGDHEAVAQIGISVDVDAAAEHIEAFRQPDGGLVIPDRELGNIGWRNLHPRMRNFVMNSASIPDRMPPAHFMIWQGRDKIYLSSCHMNPAFVSSRLCAKAKKFMPPATIDASLPALFAGTSPYIAKASDGMTFIELSAKRPRPEDRVPFPAFARVAWGQARFSDKYLWYARHLCEIPIKPQAGFLNEEQVNQQHAAVIKALEKSKEPAALDFVLRLWPTEDA